MDSSLLLARIIYVLVLIAFFISLIMLISSICSLFIIDVTNYTITSEKVPTSFDGYKILQISDLHNIPLGNNNSRLLKEIKKVEPDIIVMTGDMVNSDSKNYDTFYSLSKELVKDYQIYYIMGNHELKLTWKEQLEISRRLTSLGVKVLNNTETTIFKDNDHIRIYGLTQPTSTYKNIFKNSSPLEFSLINMQQTFPVIDTSVFNILLAHSPFDFDVFSAWKADLVLAGHVHGGLIRIPFVGGVLSPERTLFPKYDAGEYSQDNSKMIVSRGLGNGTINLRILNNPEICVITLKSANSVTQ